MVYGTRVPALAYVNETSAFRGSGVLPPLRLGLLHELFVFLIDHVSLEEQGIWLDSARGFLAVLKHGTYSQENRYSDLHFDRPFPVG